MEGLLLMGVYVLVVSVLETMAVGMGFFTDTMWPSWSMIIFMTDSGAALWVSWPIAVWLTRNRPVG